MDGRKIKNMEEFAAKCGVSRPTVSKYFHDPNSVKASTRARIEDALTQYDFRPNIYAINQNRRLTKNIGIVVPYLADPFFAEIARRIEHHCIDAGFSPTLFSSHGRLELENDILDSLRSMKPAGVLLAPLGRASDRSRIEKFCTEVPTVLFDSNIEGIVMRSSDRTTPNSPRKSLSIFCRTGEPPCYFEMKTPPNPIPGNGAMDTSRQWRRLATTAYRQRRWRGLEAGGYRLSRMSAGPRRGTAGDQYRSLHQ